MYKKFKLNKEQKRLRRRILEISHAASASHIGSCLNVVDLVEAVYEIKKKEEKFVLSCGHGAVALYVVLEKHGHLKNPSIDYLNVHPDRNVKCGIDVSTGSLGQGLPIALGMALANRKKQVFCVISDGECSEGSTWEALRLAIDLKVTNLRILVTANGFSAYDLISLRTLEKRLSGFGCKLVRIDGHNPKEILKALKKNPKDKLLIIFARTSSEQLPFLRGVDAHYHVMSEEEFALGMGMLK